MSGEGPDERRFRGMLVLLMAAALSGAAALALIYTVLTAVI